MNDAPSPRAPAPARDPQRPPPPPEAPEPADDAGPPEAEPGWRAWARPFALSMALTLLVAAGVADRGLVFPALVVVAGAVGFGALFRLFPGDAQLAFGAASGFAVYACLYAVIGRQGFPHAPDWPRAVGFLLPILALLAAAWWRAGRLRRAAAEEDFAGGHVARMGRWLGLIALVGVASLAVPFNRLPAPWQGAALLGGMALVAALVALFVEDVVRFLVDIAALMTDVVRRLEPLSVPVATFVSIYALAVIAFACLYRVADGLSRVALFATAQGPVRLTFPDALHFSVATMATVGYGDIQPTDDGVRLLSWLEVGVGQVLMLFGFYEIMNSRRVNEALGRGEDADRGEETRHRD